MNWWGMAAASAEGAVIAAGVCFLFIRCVGLVERADEALDRRRSRRSAR